jgi:hypothetical protein
MRAPLHKGLSDEHLVQARGFFDKMLGNLTTLPKVAMPNRDGFELDPRPEVQLYR